MLPEKRVTFKLSFKQPFDQHCRPARSRFYTPNSPIFTGLCIIAGLNGEGYCSFLVGTCSLKGVGIGNTRRTYIPVPPDVARKFANTADFVTDPEGHIMVDIESRGSKGLGFEHVTLDEILARMPKRTEFLLGAPVDPDVVNTTWREL
jgi:hypothetical protein